MQLNNEDCRTVLYAQDPCIFPYYWNLKLNEGCTMFEDEEFIFPVFYCPIRNMTRKINGTNSFVYDDIFVQVTVYLHQYLLSVFSHFVFCFIQNGEYFALSPLLCPSLEQEDDSLELTYDPDRNDCNKIERYPVVAPCKNNCKGGLYNFTI